MKKKWILIVLLGAMAMCLTGCPGGSSANGTTTADTDFDVNTEALESSGIQMQAINRSGDALSEGSSGKTAVSGISSNKPRDTKLIRTVRLEMKSDTNNIEESAAAIAARAGEYGGYAESNDVHIHDTRVEADLTIRIPADHMDEYLDYIESAGMRAVSKSDSVEDVTLEYTDLSSRVMVLQMQYDKYMSYLEQAQTVSEVLEIEERLTDVLSDIESLQSSINVLSNRVTYSTLYLTISWTSAPADGFGISIGEELTDAFEDLLESVVGMMHFVIVAVPNAIFYILLFGAIWRFFTFVFGIHWTRPMIWKRLKDTISNRKKHKEKSDQEDSDNKKEAI